MLVVIIIAALFAVGCAIFAWYENHRDD